MVLVPKHWKSRSSPGITADGRGITHSQFQKPLPVQTARRLFRLWRTPGYDHGAAGWSSPVARQAHNLKVVGSNPTPATTGVISQPQSLRLGAVFVLGIANRCLFSELAQCSPNRFETCDVLPSFASARLCLSLEEFPLGSDAIQAEPEAADDGEAGRDYKQQRQDGCYRCLHPVRAAAKKSVPNRKAQHRDDG